MPARRFHACRELANPLPPAGSTCIAHVLPEPAVQCEQFGGACSYERRDGETRTPEQIPGLPSRPGRSPTRGGVTAGQGRRQVDGLFNLRAAPGVRARPSPAGLVDTPPPDRCNHDRYHKSFDEKTNPPGPPRKQRIATRSRNAQMSRITQGGRSFPVRDPPGREERTWRSQAMGSPPPTPAHRAVQLRTRVAGAGAPRDQRAASR